MRLKKIALAGPLADNAMQDKHTKMSDRDVLLSRRSKAPRYGMAEPLDNALNVLLSPQRPQVLMNDYLKHLCRTEKATLSPFDQTVSSCLDLEKNKKALSGGVAGALLPTALVQALAYIAPHGWLYDGVLRDTSMSDSARTLVGALMGAGHQKPPAGSRHKLRFLDATARTALLSSREQYAYRGQMPALSAVAAASKRTRPLLGISLALCQHMFPTNAAMLGVLAELGSDPQTTHYLTKRTSVNEEVQDLLVAQGWAVTQPVPGQEVDQAADLLRDLLRRRPDQRVLIVDEGAKFITAIHRFPDLLANKHRFVCVEQTESGIATLEAMSHGTVAVPVWNVARSFLKKTWEAGFIGEDVVCCAMKALESTGAHFELKGATVLGYGAVGKHVAQSLRRRGIDVGVFDIDEARNREARDDGFKTGDRKTLFAHGPMIFGCANSIRGGEPALTRTQMAEYLPQQSVLINAGSGNYQWGLPAYAESTQQDDEELHMISGTRQASWDDQTILLGQAFDRQPHRVVRIDNSKTLLLDSGFVVNRTEDIPAPYIDLTRSLMTLACVEAATSYDLSPGLHEISLPSQLKILNNVVSHLGTLKRSLLEPRLSGLSQPTARMTAPTLQDVATWHHRLAAADRSSSTL